MGDKYEPKKLIGETYDYDEWFEESYEKENKSDDEKE